MSPADSNGTGAPLRDIRGLDALRGSLQLRLAEEVGAAAVEDTPVSRMRLQRRLIEMLDHEAIPLSAADRREITQDVLDDILGYGPIQVLLDDPTITEIMVNNADSIYIERQGKVYRSDRRFLSQDHLMRTIDRIVNQVGRRIDESSPMVDARLPDGSRVNAISHPLAINGPMLTIRKFSKEPYTARDLIDFGTFSADVSEFLDACVRGRLNILISGGTGSGKTTLLNVLSSFIPSDERTITIEDAAELRLDKEHVLRLESRPPNLEGKGEVSIRDLVRNALRMRPDRIVVGEVRGAEALDMLQAMNTGHDGSLSTIHANSPRDAFSRLETMVLMAGFDLPVRAIREQISSALHLMIHVARMGDGSRRVVEIVEVHGMEGDTILTQVIFEFDYSMGVDPDGRFRGRLKATGVRPSFADQLEYKGIRLRADTFRYDPMERR